MFSARNICNGEKNLKIRKIKKKLKIKKILLIGSIILTIL